MKCPYCGFAMTKGYIRKTNDRTIFWIPHYSDIANNYRFFFFPDTIKDQGGFYLDKSISPFKKYDPSESWHCDNCHILLTPNVGHDNK